MSATRESFTDTDRAKLGAFFTNLTEPVFGLRLPQEVAGALFSRYSRTAKSLRRVFLDEFAGNAALPEAVAGEGGEEAVRKAREFYDRVLIGYGDDSVAQLGGAHVACEGISNVAAKLLEDARIGVAFLEKSTRYVRFDQRGADGGWLYHREARLMASPHRDAYLAHMDDLFSAYARGLDPMIQLLSRSLPIDQVELRHPKTGEALRYTDVRDDPELGPWAERAYRATVRAHACDVMRSYLPAATLTNVGVFATGQAYEHLLTKLASQELAEGRELGVAMRRELDQLIPSFVKRASRSDYLAAIATEGRALAARLAPAGAEEPAEPVVLVDHDEAAEEKVIASLLYPHADVPLAQLRERVARMPAGERAQVLSTLAGARRSRRDKPGRALEMVSYTFDLVGNLGAYRDLQRHRLLTQERQAFTTVHGHDTPEELREAGFAAEHAELMGRAHDLFGRIARTLPLEAQYVVPFAFRVRWTMRMNLREAVHLCELRSMPQGHADYRVLAQEMWRRIEEVHPALAGLAKFLNRDTYRLGRLQSELRTESKRSGLVAPGMPAR